YADFEGVIPIGEYGAGPMIVWDRGLWKPVGDPREGVKAGKLLFELKGFKLKGMWTLVRIKGETGKEWLLIKETGDGHVRRGARDAVPLRSARVRGLRSPYPAAGRAQEAPRPAGAGVRPDPSRRPRGRTGPRPLRYGPRAGLGGHGRQARAVDLPQRAVPRLAEGARRQGGRLRGGRL